MTQPSRYAQIIEDIFRTRYRKGAKAVSFERQDIVRSAKKLGVKLPKNLGDVVYSFRYRAEFPKFIQDSAPSGMQWVIKPAGTARYRFQLVGLADITPNPHLAEIKVPDSTSGIIARYALSDEQALLAKLRYNRLIDVFTGVTCYSLQSHLRTNVPGMGQVETDEAYVGVDKRGAHYVLPVQAKGGSDSLNVVQIEQDFALREAKFHELICRPIGAQFMPGDVIALFEFQMSDGEVKIAAERHYRLVPPGAISDADVKAYGRSPD